MYTLHGQPPMYSFDGPMQPILALLTFFSTLATVILTLCWQVWSQIVIIIIIIVIIIIIIIIIFELVTHNLSLLLAN